MQRLPFILILLSGCISEIGEFHPVDERPDPLPGSDAGPIADGGDPPIVLPARCEDTGTPNQSELLSHFASAIYPMMVRDSGGCFACHDASSGRALTMGDTAEQTLTRLQASRMLDFEPSGFFDRVDRDSMPQGGPFWTGAEKTALETFVCDAMVVAQNTIPADEIFPPNLEEPFTGVPSTEYDNTFLSYDQLRGRIRTQFGDDWIRGGQDRFAENISLFGGVDFETFFIAAREATPEFLLGLDLMSKDVCAAAVRDHSGPFDGLNLNAGNLLADAAISDYESIGPDGSPHEAWPPNGGMLVLYSAGAARFSFTAPEDGDYEISVRAQGEEAGPDLPILEIRTGGQSVALNVPGAAEGVYRATFTLSAGAHDVEFHFTNDFYDPPNDRNLRVGPGQVAGPLGVGSNAMDAVIEGILLRPASQIELDELNGLHAGIKALNQNNNDAWAGVCEALLHHPDFLFGRMPSADGDPAMRERALLVQSALIMLDRPPTAAELQRYDSGEASAALVDGWLASTEMRDAYFKKMRLLIEADGSVLGDEPARLLTYLFTGDKPIKDALTSTYTVDENFNEIGRAAEHGATGLLTMKGYLRNKPGLPHYNYAARVMSGFLGYVFEVPEEVFDQRATSTAASTVDPESICYSCHRVLTPLAYQRLAWDDEGNFRTVDEEGLAIDDSDRGIVPAYPYPGSGMSAFASHAVRKEGYIRRMINIEFAAAVGRPIRADDDERDVYRDLWDVARQGNGTPREILRAILQHDVYKNPVGTQGVTP